MTVDRTAHQPHAGPRALFVSSPIGLGHARRDIAIARELRELVPDLRVDWLAQDPVIQMLHAAGERVHPLSAELANESAHLESESAEHDLHCFHSWRRLDEILIYNYMLFDDVMTDDRYDLVVGDEAWEIDYYLHENPDRKRAPYVWLTDFVGFLAMPDGDDYESFLTADYNAQMVEHIDAHPELRDRSIFVGDTEDLIDLPLGPGLPTIPEWTESHFDFAGHVTGFDPELYRDREKLRAQLGWGDEPVCVVTVGGSGVGESLLRRVVDAYPLAREAVPGLRMLVVAGPRIDAGSIGAPEGVDVVAFVPDLYRHLAACDLAVVQGGLTTAMELTTNRRPFLYFPLKHHFEQHFHVHHRLERHRAGRRMEYDESTPQVIATAIAQEIGRDVDYRPVDPGGARRAAQHIAELV